MSEFIKLKVSLEKSEWLALRRIAAQERREPASQVSIILRSVLLDVDRARVDRMTVVEPAPVPVVDPMHSP